MDNQQGKTTENLIWFAGFFDGEGCLDLYGKHCKKEYSYTPRARISNCHIATLQFVTDTLESANIGHHVYWRNPKQPNRSKSWGIEISGVKRVRKLLIAILPYLVTKQYRGDLMLEYCNNRVFKERRELYDKREVEIITELRKPQRPKDLRNVQEISPQRLHAAQA